PGKGRKGQCAAGSVVRISLDHATARRGEAVAKIDDKHAQLLRSKNLAATTVVRPDGSPHTTPTWIDYDGEHVLVNTAYGRAKPRYLEPNHVASVPAVY